MGHTMSMAGLFGTPDFTAGSLANEMEALSDLFEECEDKHGRAATEQEARDEELAAGVQGRLGPGDIGPKKVVKKKVEKTNDIWEAEEVHSGVQAAGGVGGRVSGHQR